MAILAQDQVTIADLTDGYSVYLELDTIVFNGSQTASLGGSISCEIKALQGPNFVAADFDATAITPKPLPTGLSISKDTAGGKLKAVFTTTTAFNAPVIVSIPIVVNGLTFVKSVVVTFSKQGPTGGTGSPGVSPVLMGLKNEAQMIPCTSDGKVKAATVVAVDFFCYSGTNRAVGSASVGSLPSGVTAAPAGAASTTSADGKLNLTFAKDSTLGGEDAGVIPITLTQGSLTFGASFAWAKAKEGLAGKDAITLEVTSSAGLFFKNTSVVTILTAKVYKGAVEVTDLTQIAAGAAIKWYKNGSATPAGTGFTFNIAAGDVTNQANYVARLEA